MGYQKHRQVAVTWDDWKTPWRLPHQTLKVVQVMAVLWEELEVNEVPLEMMVQSQENGHLGALCCNYRLSWI